MSNLSSLSGGSAPSNINISINGPGQQQDQQQQQQSPPPLPQQAATHVKKRRNLPGNPDPDAEVIALSPTTLMATNRFVCEVCNKGFQRDQNLQLHRRGHNLPWRLRQRNSSQENTVKKRVYVCPEPSCVHHDPSRALGDLTGIKKHFSRKHGEKKWKCDRCTKRYAVHSDWKAHQKTCGTREYRCDCGTLFSRRDSFITHRAFCDALAEESARATANRRPNESQHSGNPDSGTAPDGPSGALIATSTEAPSPPAVSQLTGGAPVDTLTMAEVSKPVMIDSLTDFAMLQGGPSTSSKWVVQAGMGMKSSTSNKGPGLSLCLGTGPEPVPPGALQMLGGQALPYSGMPYDIPGPHKAGAVGLVGSGANETMNLPGAGSTFASLMSSGTGYSGSQGSVVSSRDVMVRPGSLVGMMSQFDQCPPNHNFGDAPTQSIPYKHNQPQTATAHLSATALLQKAAQMGATSSNQYLLQNLGHGVANPTSSIAAQCTRQGPWSGVSSSILSSSLPAYSRGRQIDGNQNGDQNAVSSFGQGNFSEYMMNSFSGAGMMGSSMCDLPPLLGLRGYVQGHDSLLKRHMEAHRLQPNLIHGMQQQAGVSHSLGMGGIERGELDGERPMLDFLGVGGPSEMVGVTADMSHTLLQQKGLASITSLARGIKVEPLFDQSDGTQPRGMGCQRPS